MLSLQTVRWMYLSWAAMAFSVFKHTLKSSDYKQGYFTYHDSSPVYTQLPNKYLLVQIWDSTSTSVLSIQKSGWRKTFLKVTFVLNRFLQLWCLPAQVCSAPGCTATLRFLFSPVKPPYCAHVWANPFLSYRSLMWHAEAAAESGGNTSEHVSLGPRVPTQEFQPRPPRQTPWRVLCAQPSVPAPTINKMSG